MFKPFISCSELTAGETDPITGIAIQASLVGSLIHTPQIDAFQSDFDIATLGLFRSDGLKINLDEIASNEQKVETVAINNKFEVLVNNHDLPVVLASNYRGPIAEVVPRYNSPPPPTSTFLSVLAPWLDNNPNTPSGLPSRLSSNIVRSNQALILDPFQTEFEPSGDEGDEANNIEATLKAAGYIVTRKANTDVTIEDFKQLNKYGVIAFVSHGARVDMSTKNALIDHRNRSNPDRANGKVVVVTGIVAPPDNARNNPYLNDLRDGYLTKVQLPNNVTYLAITPSFINKYTPNTLPNSLVYVGACDSIYNETLAQAFIRKGAGAFVGYSRVVETNFADLNGRAMFNALVADRTTGEVPGINVNRDPGTGASFRYSSQSALDLTINIGLRNGSFEIDNLSGWVAQGDARAIHNLGPLSTPQGEEMAFISTASSSSSISQKFFVPANAKNLTFSYNLVSEEPMEYVGSEFDDQFDVLLNPAPTSSNPSPNQTTVAKATINTSTWLPISGIDFPDGDKTTFHTGFKNISFDLTSLRGQEIDLLFRVFDKGDAAFDTAALIDNIHITTI